MTEEIPDLDREGWEELRAELGDVRRWKYEESNIELSAGYEVRRFLRHELKNVILFYNNPRPNEGLFILSNNILSEDEDISEFMEKAAERAEEFYTDVIVSEYK